MISKRNVMLSTTAYMDPMFGPTEISSEFVKTTYMICRFFILVYNES